MTLLSPGQQQVLAILGAKVAEVELELQKLEENYKNQRQLIKDQLKPFVISCNQQGVPVSQICTAYGTKNRNAIYDIINETTQAVRRIEGETWDMVSTGSSTYIINIRDLGPGRWSGSANIEIKDNDVVTDTPPFRYNATDALKRQIIEAHNASTNS